MAASCPLIRPNIIHTLFGDMRHLSRWSRILFLSTWSLNETFVIRDHSSVFHLLLKILCIMNFQYIICSLFFPEQNKMSIFLWHDAWICSAALGYLFWLILLKLLKNLTCFQPLDQIQGESARHQLLVDIR